jgi:predicted signal transduction protein with EAL and GGDEF domain
VNYGFGWEEGARLLREVARRLALAVREADVVSRLASDTFAVLLHQAEPREAQDVARRILDVLSASFELGGLEVCPLACLGIASQAPGHTRAEDLLRDAERALSRAKAFGRGRIETFDAGLDARALTLWQLEVALRRALDSEDFRNHYEPMVSMKGGQVAGFEVLLWRKSTVPAARAR